jgi:hypothetical protein
VLVLGQQPRVEKLLGRGQLDQQRLNLFQ